MIDLTKRKRPLETIIQGFLFLFGALSIFTTIGIVVVLGTESISFFSKQIWEDTNKQIVSSVSADDINLELSATGTSLQVGDVIKIGKEIMVITSLNEQIATVSRGVQGSSIIFHQENLEILRGINVSLFEFFTNTKWSPQIRQFGVLPLLNATLLTTFIAITFAAPLGLAVAVYLCEYASNKVRSIVKPITEILAGIPTVVYGYFALTFMTPLLRTIFGTDVVEVYNTASAGIVMGILILPMISSMSADAINAVPNSLREAAFGLGATRLETALRVVLPAATSGLAAALVVGISRAIGETMIVAVAAGAGPNFTFNPFESAETMTGHIVRISSGDLSYDSIDYHSIFAIGLLLFLVTFALNLASRRIVSRFREEYE